MLTDPIADFLTRVRNASHARSQELTVHRSNMVKAMAETLMRKRFIKGIEEEISEEGKKGGLKISLRTDREPLELKRISKPGQRIYIGFKEIKRVRNGLGVCLISTSQGVMTGEEAREKKLGGEFICEVY